MIHNIEKIQNTLNKYKTRTLINKVRKFYLTNETIICVCDDFILEMPKKNNPTIAIMVFLEIKLTRDEEFEVVSYVIPPQDISSTTNPNMYKWKINDAIYLDEYDYTKKVI